MSTKYINGKEVKRPEPISVDALGKIHAAFWKAQAVPDAPPTSHPGEAMIVQEATKILLRNLGETHAKEKAKDSATIRELQVKVGTRTVNATAGRLDLGDATRYAVRIEAQKILTECPSIKRTKLAERIEGILNLEYTYLYKMLGRLGIPGKRKTRTYRRRVEKIS